MRLSRKYSRFALSALLIPFALLPQKPFAQPPYLHAPAVNEYAKHDPTGTTILPEGRLLRPIGTHIPLASWPHGLLLSPDGKTAFVASGGVGQFVTGWDTPNPTVTPVTPTEKTTRKKRGNAGGLAFSPDGKTLYWSSGDSGHIFVFDTTRREQVGEIALNVAMNGRPFADSFAMDLQISPDGKHLYAADVTNFRVIVMDTATNAVIGSVDVGRYPYTLAVVGKTVYVTNIGLFAYSPIPAPDKKPVKATTAKAKPAKAKRDADEDEDEKKIDKRGLTFPAFGFPSKEAKEGVRAEGRFVPGLGDPNVPDSFSLWGVDVSNPAKPKVVSKLKTGLLIGAPSDNGKTVGGSAPNFVVLHGDAVYVSNGNNDTIERIERGKLSLDARRAAAFVWKTRLNPSPLVAKLRGVGPSGMVVSQDGKRLYVAESGINAIAVLETQTGKVLGHIPTAWYPYRLTLSPDGSKLLCIAFRGFGNGPNAGKERPNSPFLGLKGALSVLNIPADAELPALTQTVLENNGIVDRSADRTAMASPVVPTTPGKASEQIKYVVFITKENHTYDAIFDRIPGAKHDPSLLKWGYNQTIQAAGQPTLENVAVMTNHNAVARQFTVSDNFYMQPEASGVGHRWLVGVMPNNFCQMTYTLGWDFKQNSTAPGRRASFGSNGSIAPEDYPEAGSMWEHLAKYKIPFRNYGEGFEFAGVLEDEDEHRTGAREVINMPMSKVLFDNTCREFPIFNMNIPDQYRAHWFQKDFTKLFLGPNPDGKGAKSKIKEMPRFVNIAICNDHGAGPNAKKGYPYVASWMADNDLAMGRIIEFLSHTPYWKNMAIFITQDDSGGEPDHVEAQRSVLLVISPWVKRGYVSHRHTTITSMHRTLYQILGLPPLNMFDALANDFSDCFTTSPDFTPYKCVPVDPRIFDPEKAKDPKDPEYKQARRTRSILRDDEEEEKEILRLGNGEKH